MSGNSWSDSDLREYIAAASGFFWLGTEADVERARFRAQVTRVIPGIQKRVLGEVGATTSADGIAFFASEEVERARPAKRAWLLVSSEPWEYLEQWIGDVVVRAYRAAVTSKDKKALKGIEAASTRREIE